MDPQATLAMILKATDVAEAREYCEYLAEWLRNGGFAPTVPVGTKYWPGTRTGYAILSPASDNGERWEFVRYNARGNRAEAWALPTEPRQ
jgi:hypothetical protein